MGVFSRSPKHRLLGKTPIYIIDSDDYLLKVYLEYQTYLKSMNDIITFVDKQKLSSDTNKLLLLGLKTNYNLIYQIKETIRKEINTAEVIDKFSNTALYIDSFKYLNRDWTYSSQGEKEVSIMVQAIKKGISTLGLLDKNNCVFLGAGTGRISVELTKNLDLDCNIIALDSSFSMYYWFEILRKSSIPFYLINLRNIISNQFKTVYKEAYLKTVLEEYYKKIHYVIADASDLPFNKESISIIFSIFFSDIIPLSILLKEVKKVIKKGGYFIHYGPLSYHFKKIFEMHTAEEFIEQFELNGFKLIHQDIVKSENLYTEGSLEKLV
jgi:SAM-dependent methyltransferase